MLIRPWNMHELPGCRRRRPVAKLARTNGTDTPRLDGRLVDTGTEDQVVWMCFWWGWMMNGEKLYLSNHFCDGFCWLLKVQLSPFVTVAVRWCDRESNCRIMCSFNESHGPQLSCHRARLSPVLLCVVLIRKCPPNCWPRYNFIIPSSAHFSHGPYVRWTNR